MNRLIVVGGKLQGTEALYLAKKAGIKTVLVDKNPNAIASRICDVFVCLDIIKTPQLFIDKIEQGDIVLPALENQEVLECLERLSKKHGFTFAFDLKSYNITSSKLLSDKLFRECGLPVPLYYPEGKAPYIVKPSNASGSQGVYFIDNEKELESFLAKADHTENLIIQECLNGPSYSIEVIGKPGNYRTYKITEIHMDEVYDCKMVTAPCTITKEQEIKFSEMAITIAEKLQLYGIMDLEVIDDGKDFKLLEIDARIPSQTPTVVYHSSGINLISELMDIYDTGDFKTTKDDKGFAASFEHHLIQNGIISSHGEHIMGESKPLQLEENVFGAQELISDDRDDKTPWRGTFINWAETEKELSQKRRRNYQRLERGEK